MGISSGLALRGSQSGSAACNADTAAAANSQDTAHPAVRRPRRRRRPSWDFLPGRPTPRSPHLLLVTSNPGGWSRPPPGRSGSHRPFGGGSPATEADGDRVEDAEVGRQRRRRGTWDTMPIANCWACKKLPLFPAGWHQRSLFDPQWVQRLTGGPDHDWYQAGNRLIFTSTGSSGSGTAPTYRQYQRSRGGTGGSRIRRLRPQFAIPCRDTCRNLRRRTSHAGRTNRSRARGSARLATAAGGADEPAAADADPG